MATYIGIVTDTGFSQDNLDARRNFLDPSSILEPSDIVFHSPTWKVDEFEDLLDRLEKREVGCHFVEVPDDFPQKVEFETYLRLLGRLNIVCLVWKGNYFVKYTESGSSRLNPAEIDSRLAR